jgi:quinol monooxygenase YgiN
MIHVVAVITAKPGQRAALLEAFAALRPAVLAEAGCIEYAPRSMYKAFRRRRPASARTPSS